MSPASLRRYRAERLLREEFRSLRAGVIAGTRSSLRSLGAHLDERDLEACYAQAWQGLYQATLDGQQIADPAGWLAVVTLRRAIDEQRARRPLPIGGRDANDSLADAWDIRSAAAVGGAEHDVAEQLDNRSKLRALFEALRLRLDSREQQAAALCYLQGLTRVEAARVIGVSDARMRKLMDGTGAGERGVSAKVAALTETIRRGGWCEEQGSLMRGFAYGLLEPGGDRHRMAIAHTTACPACRAYVASLRGLAAVLPPLPSLLGLLRAAGAPTRALALKAAVGSGAGRAAASTGARGGGLTAPGGVASGGAGAGAAAGAGAGAAGGGWLLAGGGAGAKFAAGCLIALGLGASCAVLGTAPPGGAGRARPHRAAAAASRGRTVEPATVPDAATAAAAEPAPDDATATPASRSGTARPPAALSPASMASREFGPERGPSSGGAEGAPSPATDSSPAARTAAARAEFSSPAQQASGSAPAQSASSPPEASTPTPPSAAEREFTPG